MLVESGVAQTRAAAGRLARPLGFVPTMGALHEGHLALISAARSECAAVAVSVYVNPLQFEAGEDFERYPRDLDGDRSRLERAGVDLFFAPAADAMAQPGYSTFVDVGALGASYEGRRRPSHFRGVATVVAKLLAIMRPNVLYLGQKDAQQTAVVRRMIADLQFDVGVRIVPTAREDDGLALSSRNAYLSPEDRRAAPTLYAMLERARDLMSSGVAKTTAIGQARAVLSDRASLDYVDVVDADSFTPSELRPPCFVIAAASFGQTRLLDNLWIR